MRPPGAVGNRWAACSSGIPRSPHGPADGSISSSAARTARSGIAGTTAAGVLGSRWGALSPHRPVSPPGRLAGVIVPAAAAGPSVVVSSASGWSDYLGQTKMLHLVAEVQNNDQRDVSLASVTFRLWNGTGGLIGPESTSADTGLTIVAHGGKKSPYAADVPAPS